MSEKAERLVRAAARQGVADRRLLSAIRGVPRDRFVPPGKERAAWRDRPVPIPGGQTTSQPSLIAAMIETLELEEDDRVLEIGTGYGWQTALLARLASEVWSVERLVELADTARRHLEEAGVDNAHVIVGDGTRGLAEHAPYDAIIVSAAYSEVPQPLIDQLSPGGRLVMPVGPGGAESVIVFERTDEGLEQRQLLTRARFVQLKGEHGF